MPIPSHFWMTLEVKIGRNPNEQTYHQHVFWCTEHEVTHGVLWFKEPTRTQIDKFTHTHAQHPFSNVPQFLLHPWYGHKILQWTCLYVRMSVRVCVCLSARISKKHVEISIKFSEHVKCGSGSVPLWWQCNMLLHSVQKKNNPYCSAVYFKHF